MKNLRNLRKQKKLTMKQLGAELGVAESTISLYETGNREPDNTTLIQIANYFGVSVDYLLGRTESPAVKPEQYPDNLIPYSADEMHTFDVIGTIAAGYNGRAEYDPTGDTVEIPVTMLKTRNPADYFVLQVRGDSMLPFYRNGDKVLIRRCDSVDSGTIAAIGFDGEAATLKEVRYIQGEDWIELIPLNGKYPIKRVEGAELQMCRVFGEFVCKIDDTKGHRRLPDENSELVDKFNALSADNQKFVIDLLKKMTEK